MKIASPQGQRIVSLDQFRGYTVAGMLFVNFVGGFAVIPEVFKHHGTYFSYADSIMAQFFFAVGYAYRLTFLRGLEREGAGPAYRHAVNRNLGLILAGALFYHLDGSADTFEHLKQLGVLGFLGSAFRMDVFEALVHIGLTGLWILPVIAAAPSVRIAFTAASGLAYLGLSHWFYYDWTAKATVIDGGQLGFLSWSIPMLVGSLAYDIMTARGPRKSLWPMSLWAMALMVFGYALSCLNAVNHTLHGEAVGHGIWKWLVEPPFFPPARPIDLWTMNQLAGSVSYMVFSAGFSLAVFVLFVIACDIGRLRVGAFRTFGVNALAAYFIEDYVSNAVSPWVPGDSPLWYALSGFALFFGLTWFVMRYLERRGLYLRL